MTDVSQGTAAWRSIGRFTVATDLDSVRGFAAAVTLDDGAGRDDTVPPTFPMAWLGRGEVKRALVAALDEHLPRERHAILQVEQRFDYLVPLRVNRRYTLEMSVCDPDLPQQVQIKADLFDDAQSAVCTFYSKLLAVELTDREP